MGRRQIEFLALELRDFRCFGGVQHVEFESPTADGKSGVTLITGTGASGKTALVDAVELALWGARGRRRRSLWRWVDRPDHADSLREPRCFINVDALERDDARASVRLAMRVRSSEGSTTVMDLRRLWMQRRDGWLSESIEVVANESGRISSLTGVAAQRSIDDLLPPGRAPLIVTDGEEIDMLSHLTSIRHDERETAERAIADIVEGWPEEMWREVAGPVIKAANRMVATLCDPSDRWLLPERAGRLWSGAYPVAPGIWSTDETMGVRRLTCLGLALVLGPYLAGRVSAPLVLDAPANGMNPSFSGAWLEALTEVVRPQVIVASHECLVTYPSLTLLDRVRWVRLIQNPDCSVRVLDRASVVI